MYACLISGNANRQEIDMNEIAEGTASKYDYISKLAFLMECKSVYGSIDKLAMRQAVSIWNKLYA